MKSKQNENKLKLNSNITTEKGFLSATERQLVDSSIQTFLAMNNLEKEDMQWILHPRLSKSFQNKRKQQFKNFSATIQEMSGLNRTPKQIYWYMRRAYSELRDHDSSIKKPRQGWTKQEDEELQRLILLKGLGNWVEIEKCMGKLGAKDRYDCLLSKKNGKWSLEEEQKMIEIANDIMKRDNITDKTKFKSWTELATRLQSRTYRECRRHYLLLGPTLQAKKFRFGYQDYEDLLLRLIFHYETINDESDILWSSMINQSDIWSADHFRDAWNTLKREIKKRLGPERFKEMSIMNLVHWAMENLSEMTE